MSEDVGGPTFMGALTEAKVLQWRGILHCVEASLREACRRMSEPGRLRDHMLKAGWFTGIKEPRVPAEDAVTDALVGELEAMRVEAALDHPLRVNDFHFSSQDPRPYSRRTGRLTRPTDMRWRSYDLGVDLRLEAKVIGPGLRVPTEYVSGRGMRRFVDASDPYGRDHVGGMIAYALNHEPVAWLDAIERRVEALPYVEAVERVPGRDGAGSFLLTKLTTAHLAEPLDPPNRMRVLAHLVLAVDTHPTSRRRP